MPDRGGQKYNQWQIGLIFSFKDSNVVKSGEPCGDTYTIITIPYFVMTAETPGYWKRAGDGCFKLNDYQGAIRYYMKAIELDAEYPDAWHCMGASYEHLEKHAEAARCFREERRIQGELIKQKNNPGSGRKIRMHKAFSPVRIISIGILVTFVSSVVIMALSYQLLGTIDWTATLALGVLSAAIFLARIYWKQK